MQIKKTIRTYLIYFPRLESYLKRMWKHINPALDISNNYVLLDKGENFQEAARLRSAWQDSLLPSRQRELVDNQLIAYRRGEIIDVFNVMTDALRSLPVDISGMLILEIGCSSGFYSEVFEIDKLNLVYSGCDYSEPFILMARNKYPSLHFDVEDAKALKYQSEAFDLVISGCCLLHIPEYEIAIAETARVARKFVFFHRTPVVIGKLTQYYRKQAYGIDSVEIHLNEEEFLKILSAVGLELIATYTLDQKIINGIGSAIRTYVCRKI